MQIMHLSAILLAAGLVSAQSLAGLPSCATTCVGNGIPASCNLAPACICKSTSFIDAISCCVSKSCDTADQQATLDYAKKICNPAGVTNLPTKAGCTGAAAASTGTATSETSAASSVASSISSSAAAASSSVASSLSSVASSVSASASAVASSQSSAASSVASSAAAAASSASSSAVAAATSGAATRQYVAQGAGVVGAGLLGVAALL